MRRIIGYRGCCCGCSCDKKETERISAFKGRDSFGFCLQLSEPQHGKDESDAVAKDGKQGKGREKFMDGFGEQEGNQHPEAADSRGQTKNPQGAEGGFCCVGILTEFRQKLGFAC